MGKKKSVPVKKAQTQMQSGDYEAKTGADSGALVLANVQLSRTTTMPSARRSST